MPHPNNQIPAYNPMWMESNPTSSSQDPYSFHANGIDHDTEYYYREGLSDVPPISNAPSTHSNPSSYNPTYNPSYNDHPSGMQGIAGSHMHNKNPDMPNEYGYSSGYSYNPDPPMSSHLGYGSAMQPPISMSPIPQHHMPSSFQNHRMGAGSEVYNPHHFSQAPPVNPDNPDPPAPPYSYQQFLKAHIGNPKPKPKHPRIFLFKVYAILLFQLALTAVLIGVNFFIPIPDFLFFPLFISLFIASLFVMVFVFCFRKTPVLNFVLLTLFTLLFGFSIGMLTSTYRLFFVLQAAIITFFVTFLISFVVIITRARLMWMGNLLSSLLCILIMTSIVGSIFTFGYGVPWWQMLVAGGIAVLFSFFIAYDTSLIIHRYNDNEALLAAVNLYVDIMNLFLAVLVLTGGFRRR